MLEKRKHKRLKMEHALELARLNADGTADDGVVNADILNISRGGIGFLSRKSLEVGSYYDTRISLFDREMIDAVLEIVHVEEQEKGYFNWKEQADDGSYYDDIQLYGMDAFPLQKVKVLKGDVTALDQENAIAAVYMQDDYDKKVDHSNWAGVGDQVTLRYVNSWKYFNAETGKEIPEEEIDSYEGACDVEADDYTQKTYTVVAEILVPSVMSCRYYGSPQFVLGSDTFIKDTGTKDVMHMMFDMKNNQSARAMESFLKN